MKIFKRIIVCLMLVFALGSCKKVPDDLISIVGKYSLTAYGGETQLTHEYEYYDIFINDDYTVTVKYKLNGDETTKDGTWLINDDRNVITLFFYVEDSSLYFANEYTYNFDSHQIIILDDDIPMTFTLQ